jgi:nicotinamidase-related amidase
MRKAGLLIVDAQVGFSPSQDLLTRIKAATSEYRTVAMTRFTNQPNSLFRTVLDWHDDGGDLALQVPGAVILEKSGYGLTSAHIDTIRALCGEWDLCGLETDACVLACAFSMWDAGIRPIILYDLCASPLHCEAMAVASRQFG